jgi:hypothetical protein
MQKTLARLVLGASFTAVAALSGCATLAPGEVDLPPQTLTDAPTSTAKQEAELVSNDRPVHEESEPRDAATEPVKLPADGAKNEPGLAAHKHTIVIQAGATSDLTPLTLQQASASERQRRASSDAPVAVITNRSLAELAEGAEVSVISSPGDGSAAAAAPAGGGGKGSPPNPGAAGGSATTTAAATTAASTTPPTAAATKAAVPAQDAVSAGLTEEYWRGQALKIRLDWKAAVEEVEELQGQVADLRRRFYEEDDPFYRDNEIKPSWDRALDRLQEAKSAAETQERKLTRFLEEGHRSGALPGWLREGVEFEPPATAERSQAQRRRTGDPWEPKVLDEEPRDP